MLEYFYMSGDRMKDNKINHLNIIVKSCLLVVAILLVVGASNGSEIKVTNSNLNLSLDLNAMAAKVEEDIQNDIYSSKDTYTGYLTGYAADCPLCGGHLACMPSLDVLHGNVNYQDSTYGNVRIVASSKNLTCGTIIKFQSNVNGGEPITAIVLDRGVTGTAIDLLTPTESYAIQNVGRSIISCLGQNFLNNQNILNNIVSSVSVKPGDIIVEIGPGTGNLTINLKKLNTNILAFEIDERTKKYLDKLEDDKLKVIYKDFMTINLSDYIKDSDNVHIIANIPYYITTPIIEKIIKENLNVIDMTLMVQEEVANRLSSNPGNKDYGYFTVFLNSYYNCSKEFDVNKKAFYPVPKVDSTIIKLIPNNIKIKNQEKFNNLIKDAFKQKRKMLKNNLINYDLELINNILKNYNLSLNNRAENIPLEAYIDISNKI
jgi:16S rRNA (adenine1518-N6/adenine1519-N6)-dimethyltransferase